MISPNNFSKVFIGICLILTQTSNIWCDDLSESVVQIYSHIKYICAGTLVKHNFVVTLVQCLEEHRYEDPLYVWGNVKQKEAAFPHHSLVVDIFTSPHYNRKTKYMDVAVLKLITPITGVKIKPTALCSRQSIEYKEPVILYYWDSVNIRRDVTDDLDLKVLKLNVSSENTCAETHKKQFSDTMFCAADPKKIQCFNDRGGPAAIGGEFCGIYKYGPYCIRNSEPGAFVSLANPQVIAFIKESLEE